MELIRGGISLRGDCADGSGTVSGRVRLFRRPDRGGVQAADRSPAPGAKNVSPDGRLLAHHPDGTRVSLIHTPTSAWAFLLSNLKERTRKFRFEFVGLNSEAPAGAGRRFVTSALKLHSPGPIMERPSRR